MSVHVSSTATLLTLLRKDVELYNNLLAEAEKNQDLRLVPQLEEEIAEMKDVIATLEKEDLRRHLRLISNENF